jgi:hypothetical protein
MTSRRILIAITPLLILLAISVSRAAEPPPSKPPAQAVCDHLPVFSWDTVSRALAVHKPTRWTDEDYTRIARSDFLQTVDKEQALAAEVKRFNPNITVLAYKNLVIHHAGTTDPLFLDHPDWFLHSRGKPELHGAGKIKHPLYDLRNPEVREYWVQDVDRILNIPVFDGIFLDAYAKVMDYTPVKRAAGQDPPVDFIAGYHQMMEEHVKRSGATRKLRIGNFLRAQWPDCAVPEVLKYLDGSYLEWFEHYAQLPKHLQSYEEYLAAGILAVQQVAKAGKVIILHLEGQDDQDIRLTTDGADTAAAADSRGIYKNLQYKLAIFLICAERYSYFQYQGAYKATKDFQAWAPDFPEFSKPLGPPKGPAVRNGFTYTRDFEYASVWLDLRKRQGRITWNASYPEVKTLEPGNGDAQVASGTLQCKIAFDRPVRKGTGVISLYRMNDRQRLASVPVASVAVAFPNDRTVTVTFPTKLEAKTAYSVTMPKAAFYDRNDMIFLGTPVLGQWSFITR